MIGLLFLIGTSQAQQRCPSPEDLVRQAQEALLHGQKAESEALLKAAELSFACSAPATPTLLARFWLVQGVDQAMQNHMDTSNAYFAAAARVDPTFWIDEFGPGFQARYALAARPVAPLTRLEVHGVPPATSVYLDGMISAAQVTVPVGLHLVQVADKQRGSLFAAVIYPQEDVPMVITTGLAEGPIGTPVAANDLPSAEALAPVTPPSVVLAPGGKSKGQKGRTARPTTHAEAFAGPDMRFGAGVLFARLMGGQTANINAVTSDDTAGAWGALESTSAFGAQARVSLPFSTRLALEAKGQLMRTAAAFTPADSGGTDIQGTSQLLPSGDVVVRLGRTIQVGRLLWRPSIEAGFVTTSALLYPSSEAESLSIAVIPGARIGGGALLAISDTFSLDFDTSLDLVSGWKPQILECDASLALNLPRGMALVVGPEIQTGWLELLTVPESEGAAASAGILHLETMSAHADLVYSPARRNRRHLSAEPGP